jgi:hypothetical protein
MTRKDFNLAGDTFTHTSGGNLGYSVHGKTSKYIRWVKHDPRVATFFVDDAIDHAEPNQSTPQYAWLLESKWICAAPQRVKDNPDRYLELFDMIFTHDQDLIKLDPKFKFVPAQGSWIQHPHPVLLKSKAVSMIASNKNWCTGHQHRLEWVERLRGHVDLYGRGFNEIPNKEAGLLDYHFSVAIENGQYETYFTEKILDCFLSYTIPVYLGAPDISDHFNPDGIIFLDDSFDPRSLTEDLWWSKLSAIEDNFYRALKMEVLEDYIWENYFIS